MQNEDGDHLRGRPMAAVETAEDWNSPNSKAAQAYGYRRAPFATRNQTDTMQKVAISPQKCNPSVCLFQT
jgi:hypothetical protein